MIPRLVAIVLLGISPLLPADDSSLQVITLKDKSVIRARVTEMSGGFYLARSPALGDMKIPTGEVISIREEGAAAKTADAAEPSPAAKSETGNGNALSSMGAASLKSLQSAISSKVQDLVSTRDGMNAVRDFSNSPEVKAVMNDPQVMQAIQNGDYNALMNSPAMKSLLDNPQTKALIQSVLNPHDRLQSKVPAEKPAASAE